MIEDFVISRTFNAPRDLVWKCFTDPERMKEWWGPKGFKVIASKMDLRPGGKTKFTVRWAPYNATEAEVKTFDSNRNSMTQGWSGTFEQLDAYLAKAT
jgi:uncharacterized protein YndB with AHSA1/START domain